MKDDWNFWNNGLGDTVYVPEHEPTQILDHRGNPIFIKRREKVGFDLRKRNEDV